MTTPPSQNITVLHDSREWTTRLEGEINEIRVDGRRLNDIHDVANKLDTQMREQKIIAVACTSIVVCTLMVCTFVLATIWQQ